jgi:hypothetical protein
MYCQVEPEGPQAQLEVDWSSSSKPCSHSESGWHRDGKHCSLQVGGKLVSLLFVSLTRHLQTIGHHKTTTKFKAELQDTGPVATKHQSTGEEACDIIRVMIINTMHH